VREAPCPLRPPLLDTLATRWHDNDVYGHGNNTVYYGWFDAAVNAWLIEARLLDIEHGDRARVL
jgi:acyl-CoA thioesterase FadM